MEKIRFLTGERPTGRLHVGHYAGALSIRVEMQNSGKYEPFIMVADMQALTDNAGNPQKVKDNVMEVVLDNLAVGIDPKVSTIFIQSQVPELSDLTMFYMNLVTLSRLERNPTVKSEIKQRGFGNNIPVGFLTYPISQASDITAFDAKIVPCGEDQLPVIEQAREIVRTFNRMYGDTLIEPEAVLSTNKHARRLPGTDGNAKMSKSLNNCIYLADEPEVVRKKIMSMYTDPNHIRVEDKGDTKNNPVFIYLDVFGRDKEKIKEMKEHYELGGLGDVTVKKYLNEVMQEFLEPIRQRRKMYEQNMDKVVQIVEDGCKRARKIAQATLKRVREAIGVDYFEKIKNLNK